MGAALVTLAEYKAYAGLTSPSQDGEIAAIIPKVSQLVKSLCRRAFNDYVNDPKVEVSQGGFYKILLHEGPIINLIEVEHSSDYGASYKSLVEYTDFILDRENICIQRPTGEFPAGINAYKVTYTAGYEQLPEDLKIAVLDLVKYYLKNDGAIHSPKAPGTNTVQIEYVTTTALPAYIKRILDLYTWDYS